MTDRDRRRLGGCRTLLVEKLGVVLEMMAAAGHPMGVTDGVRTTGQQMILFSKGRNPAGEVINAAAVVTYADGILKKSRHQFGEAADCAFRVDGVFSWDLSLPWELYGEAAESVGLEWGGRWTRPDRPHVQLPVLPAGTLRA